MRSIAILATTILFAPVGATGQPPRQAFAEPAFTIAMSIEEGGRVVATPRLTTTLGQAVSVRSEGPDGYAVRMLLRPGPPGSDRIHVESALTRRVGDAWTTVGLPRIDAVLGQSSTVPYAAGGLIGRVHMTVSPNVATLSTL